MSRGRHWTKDEDKVLIEQINTFPNSRKAAFEATAKLTGRKASSCSRRWYNHISLQKDTMCFATISKTQQVNNRSRATRKAPAVKRNSNWWQKMLKLLGF